MTPTLSPAYDNKIARKYSARTVEHKTENKLVLQRTLGWVEEPKQAIVCIPSALTDARGGELLLQILPGFMELSIGIVVRGKGAKKYGEFLMNMQKTHRHRIGILPDEDQEMRSMLAGADMALFMTADDDGELLDAMRYGCIPISPPRDILEDYNPIQETGNAFIFDSATPWKAFAATVRAMETFRFPYDWRTIQRHAMESAGTGEEEEKAK